LRVILRFGGAKVREDLRLGGAKLRALFWGQSRGRIDHDVVAIGGKRDFARFEGREKRI
jgi:hypothetical protein